MRGTIDGIASPDPLGRRLPSVYATDDLAQRLMAACDGTIAPIYTTLDNLWSYFTPMFAPSDFLDWLAAWVAVDVATYRSLAVRRSAVAEAIELHRKRGTVDGLRRQIKGAFGVWPEIVENGATIWSSTPGTALPGSPDPGMIVRLRVADPASIEMDRLREVVDSNRPAHVPCQIDVVTAEGPAAGVGEPPR
jgi:phage tail-like protein